MSLIKWFFMSKYQKLVYAINIMKRDGRRLHIKEAGIVLDFYDMKIELYEDLYGNPVNG